MRIMLTVVLLVATFSTVEAGGRFRRATQNYQPYSSCQPSTFMPVSTPSEASIGTVLPGPISTTPTTSALDEVNTLRAKRGLRPFIHDQNLTIAAQATANFRAERFLFGHVQGGGGDFQFLPAGTNANAAGCAAYPASYGWMSCCTYDNYQFAGAAFTIGRDGKRYMHLFVR